MKDTDRPKAVRTSAPGLALSDLVVILTFLVCVSAVELFALSKGVNGQGLNLYYASVGAAAGAVIHRTWLKRKVGRT